MIGLHAPFKMIDGRYADLAVLPDRARSAPVTVDAPAPSPDAKRSHPASVPFPVDTSMALAALIAQYDGQPLPVSFRRLVPWLKVGERATHYLHPYPAKLLPQIAHFFLAAATLSGPRATVLDPFCGSGTVALEAALSGRRAVYAEVNPFARLVVRVKTRPPIDADLLEEAFRHALRRFDSLGRADQPDVVNAGYWYDAAVFSNLASLRRAIGCEADADVREFLEVTFSAAARKVSRADPRFSVPVRRKEAAVVSARTLSIDEGRGEVLGAFAQQWCANLRRTADLRLMDVAMEEAACAGSDARSLGSPDARVRDAAPPAPMPDASVDLIITSPPYGSAQKYVRATSLSLGWLDLVASDGLSALEQRTIGREHILRSAVRVRPEIAAGLAAEEFLRRVEDRNVHRAAITATYLTEMDAAVAEMVRVLKPGGYAVVVLGENRVCGLRFQSTAFVTRMFSGRGCELVLHLLDRIPSRSLMTKRNATASVISEESILLFRKRSVV